MVGRFTSAHDGDKSNDDEDEYYTDDYGDGVMRLIRVQNHILKRGGGVRKVGEEC